MRISYQVLRRFVDVPDDVHELRELLDDLGLEVKRTESSTLLDAEDTVFDLEILANRGDHYCYAGVAREISGRTGAALQLPMIEDLPTGSSPVEVAVETDLCLKYCVTLLELPAGRAGLPPDVLAPLTASGIHSVDPLVDATNLSNVEFGQPTHVFDFDSISGPVSVRLSTRNETALPLFHSKRIELPEGTLVIADREKILAIAGVIGCEESKATAGTQRILLESATFDPVSVRRTSRRLDIRTDSSVRFERGGDPALPPGGAGRVVWLLQSHCRAEQVGQTEVHGHWTDPQRRIELKEQATNAYLNLSLTSGEMAERLTRYGFHVEGAGTMSVSVPPHRLWDVSTSADLYEELARSVGYGEIPSGLPPLGLGATVSHEETVRRTVDDVLVGNGFWEVFTDSFFGTDTAALLQFADGLFDRVQHVAIRDAHDSGHVLLKSNMLLQLLEGVRDNLRMGEKVVKMFEWARTFHPDEASGNGVCGERERLAVIACGPVHPQMWGRPERLTDIWYLKGLVQEVSVALQLPLRVEAGDGESFIAQCLHPERRGVVCMGDDVVGVLGEVHPELMSRVGMKPHEARPCYLEVETTCLSSPPVPHEYDPPPEQPETSRDVAFAMPPRVEAADVTHIIRAHAPEWLDDVTVIDCFEPDEPTNVRALTFRLYFSNVSGTRTADELNSAAQHLAQKVEQQLGDRGVRLR